jgi:hypothetical protein
MLQSYLKNGRKEKHFNVLLSLVRRNQSNLSEDYGLLLKVAKKAGPLYGKKRNSHALKKR